MKQIEKEIKAKSLFMQVSAMFVMIPTSFYGGHRCGLNDSDHTMITQLGDL